jgi:hypothetical protein
VETEPWAAGGAHFFIVCAEVIDPAPVGYVFNDATTLPTGLKGSWLEGTE